MTNNTPPIGWCGIKSQLMHTLKMYGAERSPEGEFFVRGGIYSFMGMDTDNAEIVVKADAQCRINGEWCNIVPLMTSTSYGLKVTVF